MCAWIFNEIDGVYNNYDDTINLNTNLLQNSNITIEQFISEYNAIIIDKSNLIKNKHNVLKREAR